MNILQAILSAITSFSALGLNELNWDYWNHDDFYWDRIR